jgi:hypothetical protein
MAQPHTHKAKSGPIIQIGWFLGVVVPTSCLLLLASLLWASTRRVEELRRELTQANIQHAAIVTMSLATFNSRVDALVNTVDQLRMSVEAKSEQ